MSGQPVTNADLMRRLVDIEQGLTARLDDHERRISMIEPMRDSYRTLIECSEAQLRQINALASDVRRIEETVAQHVETRLRPDILELRRELLSGQAELVRTVNGLSALLRDRPCVLGEPCAKGERDA